ncbi:hypothetical protein CapIbe_007879 [Capra ibex]
MEALIFWCHFEISQDAVGLNKAMDLQKDCKTRTSGEVHVASLGKLLGVFVVNTVRAKNSGLMASSGS